jgi:TonB family protein
MARRSSLERRFSAMLNGQLNRTPVTRRARLVTTLAAVMITVLIAGFGAAQAFSSFSGSVLDATDRVVPGVTLVLANLQSRAKYEIRTDAAGRFEFVGLPPGDYTWEAALPGFRRLRGSLAVAGRDIRQDLNLQVGSLEETLTITGGPSSSAPTRDASGNVEEIRRRERTRPCAAGPTGGTINAPRKIGNANPRYPEHLSAAKIGGPVVLDLVIDASGDVGSVSVVSSPHPGLEIAAIEAVRQWQFTATMLNCVPVEVSMRVTANFVAQP